MVFRSLLVFLGILMTIAGLSRPALAQTSQVHVIEISGTIDLGVAAFLERQIDEAESNGATSFIVVMNTPGGRVDAAVSMRDALLATDVPTLTLVDTTALSAGALIALATDTIYMVPGAVIGAATPVNGVTGETADAKAISAVRGLFESTAEATGRDASYAAAMVDPDVEIPDIIERGDLLTLTASSAVESGLAAAEIAGLDDVLIDLGVDADSVAVATPGLLETISRFVTSSAVAGLLLLAAIGLLIAEVTTGSGGLFAFGGIAFFALFFFHSVNASRWFISISVIFSTVIPRLYSCALILGKFVDSSPTRNWFTELFLIISPTIRFVHPSLTISASFLSLSSNSLCSWITKCAFQ